MSTGWRTVVALFVLFGAVVLAGASARAGGVTREHLESQGWTCVPFLPGNRYSCFDPGLGRPFPGNPDLRPSYTFLGFDISTGAFIGTGHLIRQDLYRGQPCAPGGGSYVFRAAIGYYECFRA